MAWSFQLAARATGQSLGELRDAHSRTIRFPLNRTPTVQFTIDAAHPLATQVLGLDQVLLKAYDDSTGSKVLRFIGPVVGYEKTRNGQGGTIAVTAAGPQWRIDRRLIGKNASGATFGTTSVSLLDRGEIMGRIIDALNTGEASNIFTDAGDTGVRRGTITASSTTFVSDWRYKAAGEALADLSGTLDGPDWEIAPVEPTVDATGLKIGALNASYAIGSSKPNVSFEFGTGRNNVAEWKDIGDAGTLATRAISLPPGFPDNATEAVLSWDDTAAITLRGLYETVVSADLQTSDLRTKLIQDHVRVRKQPRRIVTFTPVAEDSSLALSERRVPALFGDYIVGDTIVFRAIERFPVYDSAGTVTDTLEVPTVDALMRVYAADVQIDDNGVGQTQLTLQSDL